MKRFDRVKSTLEEIAAYRFGEETNEGDYNRVSVTLADLEGDLRELVQAATAADMAAVFRKLEDDAKLSADDLELIRLWMVSDAEFYVQMENDYKDWLGELNRLISVIDDLRGQRLTTEALGKLSGTVRDAIRVIGDVAYSSNSSGAFAISNGRRAGSTLTTSAPWRASSDRNSGLMRCRGPQACPSRVTSW